MNRNYYHWLVADTSSQLASTIRSFALPVLVVLAGGTNTQAGSLFAIATFIAGALALVGGVIIDRSDRRLLFLVFNASGILIFAFSAAWVVWQPVTWALLTVIAVVTGIRAGLLGQVSNVMLRHIVPSEALPKAMALNQGRDASIELAGPPLGGFLAGLGALTTFLAEVVLNLIALVNVYLLPKTSSREDNAQAPVVEEGPTGDKSGLTTGARVQAKVKTLFSQASAGIVLILRNPILRVVALVSALYFPLLNGLIFALILNAINHGQAPVSAAIVNSSVAVGFLIGAAIAGYLTSRVKTGLLIGITLTAPVIFGALALLTPNFWLRLLVLVPLVLMLPAGNAAFGGFQMKLIPEDLLGRTFAFLELLGIVVAPFVGMGVGLGLDRVGIYATGAVLLAGMAALAAACYLPRIRNIPTPKHWDDYIAHIQLRR